MAKGTPPRVFEIHSKIKSILPDSPTIVEVGANTGQDTELILKHCRSDHKYFAFEPDPLAFEALKELQLPITLIQAAVSSYDGVASLFRAQPLSLEETVFSSILKPTFFNYSCDQVKVIKLDNFLNQHVDLIWIDAQGSEFDLILGAQRLLSQTDWLYIEVVDSPRYEGERTQQEVVGALPGHWEMVGRYSHKDILLKRR